MSAIKAICFQGTVRENLLMGCPNAGEDALWMALEQVKLADFLRSAGIGYPAGREGVRISGGQCQRLALARALLHDSPVYLFDEASSNIDVESETDVMAQIHQLAKTKTVILISHRLVHVADADRIYVMDGGRVVESGSHEQLLSTGGHYAKLWAASRSWNTTERRSTHEKEEADLQ